MIHAMNNGTVITEGTGKELVINYVLITRSLIEQFEKEVSDETGNVKGLFMNLVDAATQPDFDKMFGGTQND